MIIFQKASLASQVVDTELFRIVAMIQCRIVWANLFLIAVLPQCHTHRRYITGH